MRAAEAREFGIESQFFRNDELYISRRFDERERAIEWATSERTGIEHGPCPRCGGAGWLILTFTEAPSVARWGSLWPFRRRRASCRDPVHARKTGGFHAGVNSPGPTLRGAVRYRVRMPDGPNWFQYNYRIPEPRPTTPESTSRCTQNR
jgi:hypothetical protein